MADEKVRLSRNDLNRAYQRQLDKRTAAPAPTAEKAATYIGAVTTAAAAPPPVLNDFFAAWDKYYPHIVSLLGWASWFLPGSIINPIKALLAVVNNVVIPALKDIFK